MIQTLYGLKCDECKTCTSIVSTDKAKLIASEIDNGPWTEEGRKHLCPACSIGMRPCQTRPSKVART